MCGMALLAGAMLQLVTGSAPRLEAIGFATPAETELSQPADSGRVAPPPTVTRLTPDAAGILLAIAHRTADASDSGALFAAKSWYTPPPPPPPAPVVEVVPTAPPLPFAFLGSYTDANNETVYFLSRDDRVYDLKAGDAIDSIYSVVGVENGQLVIHYKPLDTRQLLPIGASQ